MPTLVLSPRAIPSSIVNRDEPTPSTLKRAPTSVVARSSILPSSTSIATTSWQALPPLLSRLPPALLASPESDPKPITELDASKVASISTSATANTTLLPDYTLPSASLSSRHIKTGSQTNDQAQVLVGYTQSHLPAIDKASLALHYALYKFRTIDVENYATARYEDAFNWDEIQLPLELEREWYIVAFRSIRKKGADTTLLYQADREAHEEAVTAGGLLLYWYGSPNEKGENLATCIWQSRKHALLANRNPKHAIAAKLASTTYETYNLERYVLRKEKGNSSLSVVPWEGGDVGF